MRPLITVLALPLLAGAASAETSSQEYVGPAPPVIPAPSLAPPQGAGEASGQVINPDVRCHDGVVVADGRDGEAEFRREPAGPTPPPLYYAVDYEVEGCDVLMTTTGELRQLPELPDEPRIIPAQ